MSLENFLIFFLFLLILQPNFLIKRFLIKKKRVGLLLPLLDKVVDKVVVVHEEFPIVPLGRNILGRDEFSHPAKKTFFLKEQKVL